MGRALQAGAPAGPARSGDARAGSHRHQPRVNLPLRLSPLGPEGLLAPAAAASQAPARKAWPARRQLGRPDRSAPLDRRTTRRRPVEPRPLEADFMLFARYGQAVLVLHERCSRLTLAAAPPNRCAEPTAQRLVDLLAPMPRALRQTVSFDNGPEFARHHQLTDQLGIQTFFCDPRSPWQKSLPRRRPGAASKTPSAGYDEPCHAKPTSMPSVRKPPPTPHAPTTTHRENVSTSKPQPRHSHNSNQPLHFKSDSTFLLSQE